MLRDLHKRAALEAAYVAKLIMFFEALCNLLADRVRSGEAEFIDAVDRAYLSAQANGLIYAIGDDRVQNLMRTAFMDVPRRPTL